VEKEVQEKKKSLRRRDGLKLKESRTQINSHMQRGIVEIRKGLMGGRNQLRLGGD